MAYEFKGKHTSTIWKAREKVVKALSHQAFPMSNKSMNRVTFCKWITVPLRGRDDLKSSMLPWWFRW